ncbi:MAG: transaldolase [Gammaproteobacteria bacterium]|nr:transaldolase [Gammaproteobacteria bacterium]|tara:strand:+ start:5256 stop:5960 length:705 start_codon:yes stop_codon:yes gene_type:complete
MKKNLPIEIYADGPTMDEINGFDMSLIKGITFNPTLFRSLGVTDYLGHCKELIQVCGDTPISLEVFADDNDEMIRQGKVLGALSDSVYVKIPVTNTKGEYTTRVLEELASEKIKLNITAVFTKDQVTSILPYINHTKSIISVFSGRIFDIGLDAVDITREIADLVHSQGKCRVLWASPRMVYDAVNACNANCDIITMPTSLINKLALFGKTPEQFSIETVQMFYNDANQSAYEL